MKLFGEQLTDKSSQLSIDKRSQPLTNKTSQQLTNKLVNRFLKIEKVNLFWEQGSP